MTSAMRTMTLAIALALLGTLAVAGAWAHHLGSSSPTQQIPLAVVKGSDPNAVSANAEEHVAVLGSRVAQAQAAHTAAVQAAAVAQAAADAQAAQAAQAAKAAAATPPPTPKLTPRPTPVPTPRPTPKPTPVPTPTPAPPAPAQPQSIPGIITAAFSPLGSGAVTWALRVARCESGYNPNAVNASSGASGLFQFLRSTWVLTPYAGSSVFDPVANARAAAWLYVHGGPGNWQCK